jgi:hypothetical protein
VNAPALPRLPVWCLFCEIAGNGDAVISVDRMPCHSHWQLGQTSWALDMMAAVDHRIALLLNQSGKVPSLKAGKSRGVRIFP